MEPLTESALRALKARTELALDEYLRLIEVRRHIAHRVGEAASLWNAKVFGRLSDHIEGPAATPDDGRHELEKAESSSP
jgi:hypothetical protein